MVEFPSDPINISDPKYLIDNAMLRLEQLGIDANALTLGESDKNGQLTVLDQNGNTLDKDALKALSVLMDNNALPQLEKYGVIEGTNRVYELPANKVNAEPGTLLYSLDAVAYDIANDLSFLERNAGDAMEYDIMDVFNRAIKSLQDNPTPEQEQKVLSYDWQKLIKTFYEDVYPDDPKEASRWTKEYVNQIMLDDDGNGRRKNLSAKPTQAPENSQKISETAAPEIKTTADAMNAGLRTSTTRAMPYKVGQYLDFRQDGVRGFWRVKEIKKYDFNNPADVAAWESTELWNYARIKQQGGPLLKQLQNPNARTFILERVDTLPPGVTAEKAPMYYSYGPDKTTFDPSFLKLDAAAAPAPARSAIEFEESPSSDYDVRTKTNIVESDITIAYAADYGSPGERATAREAKAAKTQFYQFGVEFGDDVERANRLAPIYEKNTGQEVIINIAGNGEYQEKMIPTDQLTEEIAKDLAFLQKKGVGIVLVRSGGQTGADEAGVKAAVKLGIPAKVLAPKGWKFRTGAPGGPHTNRTGREAFLARFGSAAVVSPSSPAAADQTPKVPAWEIRNNIYSSVGKNLGIPQEELELRAALTNPTNNILKTAKGGSTSSLDAGRITKPLPVVIDRKIFPSAEHAYFYISEKLKLDSGSQEALDAMAGIIAEKFRQHPKLAARLQKIAGEAGMSPVDWIFAQSHFTGKEPITDPAGWTGEGKNSRFLQALAAGYQQYEKAPDPYAGLSERDAAIKNGLVRWAQTESNWKYFPTIDSNQRRRTKQNYFLSEDTSVPLYGKTRSWTAMQKLAAGIVEKNPEIMRRTVGATGAFGMPYEKTFFQGKSTTRTGAIAEILPDTAEQKTIQQALREAALKSGVDITMGGSRQDVDGFISASIGKESVMNVNDPEVLRRFVRRLDAAVNNLIDLNTRVEALNIPADSSIRRSLTIKKDQAQALYDVLSKAHEILSDYSDPAMRMRAAGVTRSLSQERGNIAPGFESLAQIAEIQGQLPRVPRPTTVDVSSSGNYGPYSAYGKLDSASAAAMAESQGFIEEPSKFRGRKVFSRPLRADELVSAEQRFLDQQPLLEGEVSKIAYPLKEFEGGGIIKANELFEGRFTGGMSDQVMRGWMEQGFTAEEARALTFAMYGVGLEGADQYEESPARSKAQIEASFDYQPVNPLKVFAKDREGKIRTPKEISELISAATVLTERLFPGLLRLNLQGDLGDEWKMSRKAKFRPIFEFEGGYDPLAVQDILASTAKARLTGTDSTIVSLFNLAENPAAFDEIMEKYLSQAVRATSLDRKISRGLVGEVSELSRELSGLVDPESGVVDPRRLVQIMREGTKDGQLTVKGQIARNILKAMIVVLPSRELEKFGRLNYSDRTEIMPSVDFRVSSPFKVLPGGAIIDADTSYILAYGMPRVMPYKITSKGGNLQIDQVAKIEAEDVANQYVPKKPMDRSGKISRIQRDLLVDAQGGRPLTANIENAEEIRLAKLNFIIENIDLLYQTQTWHMGGQPVAKMASAALKANMSEGERVAYQRGVEKDILVRTGKQGFSSLTSDITGGAGSTRWYNAEVPPVVARPILDVLNYSADTGSFATNTERIGSALPRSLVSPLQNESLSLNLGGIETKTPVVALSRWTDDIERVLADMDPGKTHKVIRDLFVQADEILKVAFAAGQSLGYGSVESGKGLTGIPDAERILAAPDVVRAGLTPGAEELTMGNVKLLAEHLAYQLGKVRATYRLTKATSDPMSPIVPDFGKFYDFRQSVVTAEEKTAQAQRKENGPFYDEMGNEISKEEHLRLMAESDYEITTDSPQEQADPTIRNIGESLDVDFGKIRDPYLVENAARMAGVPVQAYSELLQAAGRDLYNAIEGKIRIQDSEILGILKRNEIVPTSGSPILPEEMRPALLAEVVYQAWDDYSYNKVKDVRTRIPLKYKNQQIYATLMAEGQPTDDGKTEPKIIIERAVAADEAIKSGKDILIKAGVIDTLEGDAPERMPRGRVLMNSMLGAMSQIMDAVSATMIQQARASRAEAGVVYSATPEGFAGAPETEPASSIERKAYENWRETIDSKVLIDAAERYFGDDVESFELFKKLFSHLSGAEFPERGTNATITRGQFLKAAVKIQPFLKQYVPDFVPEDQSGAVRQAMNLAQEEFNKARKFSMELGRDDIGINTQSERLVEIMKKENWDAISGPIRSVLMQRDLEKLAAQISWISNEFGIDQKVLVEAIGGEDGIRKLVEIGPESRSLRVFERALTGKWQDLESLRQTTDVAAIPGQESLESKGETIQIEDTPEGPRAAGSAANEGSDYSRGEMLDNYDDYNMVPYEQGKLVGATGGSIRDMLARVGRPLREAPGSMGAMHGVGGFGAGAVADVAYMGWKGYLSPEALAMSAAFNSLNFLPKNIAPKLGVAGAIANIGLTSAMGGDTGRAILQTIGGLAGGAIGAFGGGFGAIGGSIAGSEIGDYIWSDILGNKYKSQSIWNRSVSPDMPGINKLPTRILP